MNNDTRPNVVYLFCDELRADALHCYGNRYIQTPNIDRIANTGLRFDRCYCNSPVCVASRFSMLTSLYPEQTGVYHNEAAYQNYRLPREWTTFPELFRAHGYKTASFGKTHIPQTEKPVFEVNDRRGAEMNLGIDLSEVTDRLEAPGGYETLLGSKYPADKKYHPETVTDHTLAWLETQGEQPFFVRASYLQPHTPISVPAAYVERLRSVDFSGEITSYETSLFEKRFRELCDIGTMTEQDAKKMRLYYHASVLWLDDQVGRILRFLEENELLANTILVFQSDHGANRGENGALAKQLFTPQSHRIPFLLSYPKRIPQGVVSDVCEGVDLAPTLLRLCDLPVPDSYVGVDLMTETKEFVYATIGYGEKATYTFPNKLYGVDADGGGWPRRACIRSNRYRFDMNVKKDGVFVRGDFFFCDCEKYPNEDVNCIDDPTYRAEIADLRARLERHLQDSVEADEPNRLVVTRGK